MPSQDASPDALLADLNEPQRAAVTHRDGPLLVIAGPGSGKTRVITRRAAQLVRSGVPAHNILAITFTNKAADEMRKRIEALGVGRGMWVYTFHALGVRLLRELGPLARVQAGFTIYDEDDALRVVKEALEICRVSEALVRPDAVRAAISAAKNKLQTAEQVAAQADWFEAQAVARVYEAYQQLLEQRNAVDFDDLLMKVALVLGTHADVTERLNIRFRYLLIDEYQDTNHAQYLMARYLSQHHGNICATGDPDQSIYAWRGANIRNILEFERDYPDAKVVRLEQNYRSAGNILKVASRLIAQNTQRKHKELWTARDDGAPVHVWQFGSGYDEAEQIARRIREGHVAGRPWSDFAIFYRINAVSRGLEDALRERGIPYKIARGVEFYNRKEIRDVLAYLRVLVNPADDVALLRIINTPARGIGKTSLERLQTCAAEKRVTLMTVLRVADTVPSLGAAAKRVGAFVERLDRLRAALALRVPEAVSLVLTESGLEDELRREREAGGEDRLANVQELVTAALRYEQESADATLEEFLTRVSLASDQDQVDEHAGVVMLMTLHAAKGLEFPVVFLVGLEQGLLPHERALDSARREIEEERRLCFVGLTRAMEQLYLTRAAERVVRGQPLPRPASQFLAELDDGGLVWEGFQQALGSARYALRDDIEVVVDDLPPDEAARLLPKRKLRARAAEGDADAFRPVDEETAPRRRKARATEEEGTSADEEARAWPRRKPHVVREGAEAQPGEHGVRDSAEFAGWKPGMLVQHEQYGVGQIVWIRPAPGQTRAAVKFAGHGEKTLILELAPVRRLERR